jgi:hypothetical protein
MCSLTETEDSCYKANINPEWNDDLTLSVVDPNLPVLIVSIYNSIFFHPKN